MLIRKHYSNHRGIITNSNVQANEKGGVYGKNYIIHEGKVAWSNWMDRWQIFH